MSLATRTLFTVTLALAAASPASAFQMSECLDDADCADECQSMIRILRTPTQVTSPAAGRVECNLGTPEAEEGVMCVCHADGDEGGAGYLEANGGHCFVADEFGVCELSTLDFEACTKDADCAEDCALLRTTSDEVASRSYDVAGRGSICRADRCVCGVEYQEKCFVGRDGGVVATAYDCELSLDAMWQDAFRDEATGCMGCGVGAGPRGGLGWLLLIGLFALSRSRRRSSTRRERLGPSGL